MGKILVILIEPGHGKETPGKRSPNGLLREYAWNRKTAKAAVEKLNSFGFNSVLLVPEENDVPLAKRVRRANEYCQKYGKENVIYVSVHVNAAGPGNQWMKARGWSVWTTPGQTESDKVANDLYEAAVQKFTPKNLNIRQQLFPDGDPDYEEYFYVLKNTKCPTVLIENFFMDNKEDYEYLMSDESIVDCSEVIVNGLVAYIQKRESA